MSGTSNYGGYRATSANQAGSGKENGQNQTQQQQNQKYTLVESAFIKQRMQTILSELMKFKEKHRRERAQLLEEIGYYRSSVRGLMDVLIIRIREEGKRNKYFEREISRMRRDNQFLQKVNEDFALKSRSRKSLERVNISQNQRYSESKYTLLSRPSRSRSDLQIQHDDSSLKKNHVSEQIVNSNNSSMVHYSLNESNSMEDGGSSSGGKLLTTFGKNSSEREVECLGKFMKKQLLESNVLEERLGVIDEVSNQQMGEEDEGSQFSKSMKVKGSVLRLSMRDLEKGVVRSEYVDHGRDSIRHNLERNNSLRLSNFSRKGDPGMKSLSKVTAADNNQHHQQQEGYGMRAQQVGGARIQGLFAKSSNGAGSASMLLGATGKGLENPLIVTNSNSNTNNQNHHHENDNKSHHSGNCNKVTVPPLGDVGASKENIHLYQNMPQGATGELGCDDGYGYRGGYLLQTNRTNLTQDLLNLEGHVFTSKNIDFESYGAPFARLKVINEPPDRHQGRGDYGREDASCFSSYGTKSSDLDPDNHLYMSEKSVHLTKDASGRFETHQLRFGVNTQTEYTLGRSSGKASRKMSGEERVAERVYEGQDLME